MIKGSLGVEWMFMFNQGDRNGDWEQNYEDVEDNDFGDS